MDTDSSKLISPDIDWRQREMHFDRLFPQQVNLILAVVDGQTPDLAEAGTAALTAALARQPKLFSVVRAARRRRLLQQERPAVPLHRGSPQQHAADDPGGAVPGGRWRPTRRCAES